MSLRIEILPVSMEYTAKIRLDGRLDSNTSAEFDSRMEKVVSEAIDILILDLSKLTYISSAGIRSFMLINNKLGDRDGSVLLINLQPQIAQVLEAIKQLPHLNVFGSDEELDAYLTEIQEQVLREKQSPSDSGN